MTTETITSARGILKTADSWLERAERQLAEVQAEIDTANRKKGELAEERQAHEKALADLTAKQVAEHEARIKEISVRESALAVAQREVQAERQRVAARERDVERRAADLGNRLRGVA
jgi:chromosome segregation ATPase